MYSSHFNSKSIYWQKWLKYWYWCEYTYLILGYENPWITEISMSDESLLFQHFLEKSPPIRRIYFWTGHESVGCHYVPNAFLMSCLLFLGTFLLSYTLKGFKTASLFPTIVRSLYVHSIPSSIFSFWYFRIDWLWWIQVRLHLCAWIRIRIL